MAIAVLDILVLFPIVIQVNLMFSGFCHQLKNTEIKTAYEEWDFASNTIQSSRHLGKGFLSCEKCDVYFRPVKEKKSITAKETPFPHSS